MSDYKLYTTNMTPEAFRQKHQTLRDADHHGRLHEVYFHLRNELLGEGFDEESAFISALIEIAHSYSGIERIEVSHLLEVTEEVKEKVIKGLYKERKKRMRELKIP